MKDDLISRQAAIDVEGLDEQIRCEMCRNPMHTNRGCDGNCKYDEKLYERIMQILGERIKHVPSAQPEQDREFIKLTVRNSNGRPYYSIIYLEFDDNGVGHDFEGYSSYSLDVISDYLKKYFMPSAQPNLQQSCNQLATDVISRQAAIDAFLTELTKRERKNLLHTWSTVEVKYFVVDMLEKLPSAQPKRKWTSCSNPPKHHKDVIVRGIEAIGNVTVHKVMQWDVDTWRPTDYAPSVMWKEWSEI